MKHYLKIWPQYYERVKDGSKTFEVRKNDRDFQAGDEVILNEYDPKNNEYSGKEELHFKIGYVFPVNGNILKKEDDLVVFSLLSLDKELK